MKQEDENSRNQNLTTAPVSDPLPQQPSPTPVTSVPQQAPGGKKKLMIIVVVIVLVLLGGGVAAWKFMQKDTKTSKDSAKTSQAASDFDTSKDTVATVNAKMKDLITTQGAFMYNDPEASGANLQIYVSKDDYAVAVDTTVGLYAALNLTASPVADSPETQTAATKKAGELFTQLNDYIKGTKAFTTTVVKQYSETGDYASHVIFSKTGFVCDASLYIVFNPSFSIGCVKQADADAALADYAPFIAEYLKHGEKVTTYSIEHEDGKNNYKITTLFTGIKQVFLQKPGTSDWRYFGKVSYQTPEDCSLYEADADAVLAFAGDACYRNNASSTVGNQ